MIKANELRTGNYLQNEGTKKVVKVYGIINDDVYYSMNNAMNRKAFNPIPINAERLLKFGFVFIDELNIYEIKLPNEDSFSVDLVEKEVLITAGALHDAVQVPCEYVHQLQNLYFALTGQELEIIEFVK